MRDTVTFVESYHRLIYPILLGAVPVIAFAEESRAFLFGVKG